MMPNVATAPNMETFAGPSGIDLLRSTTQRHVRDLRLGLNMDFHNLDTSVRS